MEYIDQSIKEIRNDWFSNHQIKRFDGGSDFARISFGETGTRMYQVDYVLSDSMIFITGDLGDASYRLTCDASLENIQDFNLGYFTEKLTSSERKKYVFDSKLAQREIEDFIFDICNVEHIDQLHEEDRNLLEEILIAATEWNLCEHFEMAVFSIYESSSVEWFDGDAASHISNCGKRLSKSIIAYWVGLQMVAEKMEGDS
ncbi:hypothetical protein GCM10008931_43570 [Oceanobacillus oncorhynchi subsp. oncorhynchi]|uniref:hypothetical protein n=1 Tax=Oceanobacillus oncorhynchi TaxID=545501 RepID=UPI0031D247F3